MLIQEEVITERFMWWLLHNHYSPQFYVIDRGWVAAGDLVEGDEVYLIDGSTAYVTGAELEKLAETITDYNAATFIKHFWEISESKIAIIPFF